MDDNPSKEGRLIHGVRVYSRTTSLVELCRKLHVREVLISTSKISGERLTAIVGECAAAGLLARRALMSFEPLRPTDFGWVVPDNLPELPAPALLVSRLGDKLVPDLTSARADN
jgi:hypothetical protein